MTDSSDSIVCFYILKHAVNTAFLSIDVIKEEDYEKRSIKYLDRQINRQSLSNYRNNILPYHPLLSLITLPELGGSKENVLLQLHKKLLNIHQLSSPTYTYRLVFNAQTNTNLFQHKNDDIIGDIWRYILFYDKEDDRSNRYTNAVNFIEKKLENLDENEYNKQVNFWNYYKSDIKLDSFPNIKARVHKQELITVKDSSNVEYLVKQLKSVRISAKNTISASQAKYVESEEKLKTLYKNLDVYTKNLNVYDATNKTGTVVKKYALDNIKGIYGSK